MKKGKWIQWAILSVVVSGLIIWRMVPTMGAPAWAAAIYAPVLFLMGYSAGGQAVRVRYAARMFVVSDLLLGTYFTVLPDPLVHVIYMLLFYLALLLMAICHEGKRAGTETAGK